jgi:hypothetical protein
MVGGYIYGGYNPMTEKNITIHNDGTVELTMDHLYSDRFEGECSITRSELERLAGLIINSGFFEMADVYDCTEYNPDCREQKKKYPRPVPLKLWVMIDDFEKEVEVTLFERSMIDYPDGIDTLVNEINEYYLRIIEGR